MNRLDVLRLAGEAVTGREVSYGKPENNFALVAQLWSAFLGIEVRPEWVGSMLAMLKLARAKGNPTHADSWIDVAGYAAVGAEVAGAE